MTDRSEAGSSSGDRRSWRVTPVLLLRLGLSILMPAAIYAVVRTPTRSDVTALAIAAAIPLAVTVAVAVARRRLDKVGALSLAGFALAMGVALVTGGNAVLIEVRDAPLTGAAGLTLLISALIGRPLLPSIVRMTGRSVDAWTPRTAILPTAIVGVTLMTDAAARVVLAASVGPEEYLTLGRLAGWGILGLGLVTLLLLGRRRRRQLND